MPRRLMTASLSSRSSQLLRSTALMTLMPLMMAAQPALADLILDNGNAPNHTGTPSAITGTWSMNSPIWLDDSTNQYVALGPNQTGVLMNPAPAGAVLTLDGTIDIGGLVVEDGGFKLKGGVLTNSSGVLSLSAGLQGTLLNVESALAGDVTIGERLEVHHEGTSTGVGILTIKEGATFHNAGSLTGDVALEGTLTLQDNTTLTGDIQNTDSGVLDLADTKVVGSVDNADGDLTVSAVPSPTAGAEITGDLTSKGSIGGLVSGTKLTIGGRFTNDGEVNTDLNTRPMTIIANEILLLSESNVSGDVTLKGTEVNQDDLVFSTRQTLAGGQIDGGLLNEGDGTVTVTEDLDGSNYDITNQNTFTIQSGRWGDPVSVTNVKTFRNLGNSATLTIQEFAELSAQVVENSGKITNAGTLTGLSTAGTPITNLQYGHIENTGTIKGDIANKGGAKIENYNTIEGDVTNDGGGTLTSNATIKGDVENTGTVTLSGEITGKLTNNANGPINVFDLGGDLEVGGLDNRGRITIDAGETLTNNGAKATNSGRLDVDGTLTGEVANSGTLDVAGMVSGQITNAANALLTSSDTARIGGLINRSSNLQNSIKGNVTGSVANNVGASLKSTADIGGDLLNDGSLAISGSVAGMLKNRVVPNFTPSLTLTGDLDVGQLVNEGSINIDTGKTLTTDTTANNSGTLNVHGKLDGAVANSGALNVSGTVTRIVTNNGNLNSTGTIGGLDNYSANATNAISGNVTGSVVNNADAALVSTADIGGNVRNDGNLTISGKVGGRLTNNATGTPAGSFKLGGNLEVGGMTNNGAVTIESGHILTSASEVDNNGTLDVDGTLAGSVDNDGTLDVTGTVTGKVTNNKGATLTSTGTLGSLENDSEKATISGRVTGDVDNLDDGTLVSSAIIGGDVDNAGTANLSNSVAGAITNSGTLNVTGTLVTGANVAQGKPSITNSGTFNLTGGVLTANVQNDKTMNMTGGKLTGSLTNDRQLNISGSNSIVGDLTSTGTITGTSAAADLLVSDGTFFFNDGRINVTNGNKLTITADFIELGDTAHYDNANVTLIGGLANSGEMNIHENDTLEGNLLNRASGRATLSAAMDAAGFDVTNEGDFLVTTDSNSVGNLHNVGTLTNSGTFDIESGTTVSAGNTVNKDGTLIVGGTLTTTLDNQQAATLDMDGGKLVGGVTNAGRIEGTGTITGPFVNNGTVHVDANDTLTSSQVLRNTKTVEIDGTLAGNLRNDKAGTVTLGGGTVTGYVNNIGNLTGTGKINGTLSNSGIADLGGTLQAVNNSGTLGTNGNLAVASMVNTGTVNVDANDRLDSTAAIDNQNKLNVAGTLGADLINGATGETEMQGGTLAGAVTNNGSLTGTGNITGTLQNNKTATIAGSANAITNGGTLTSSGNLSIDKLASTGTTNVTGNTTVTVAKPFSNEGTLNVTGNLVTALSNAPAGTTLLQGGTITGNVANAGNLGGNGTITGALTNTGSVGIKAGDRLAAASTNNLKTLDISGTLDGPLLNGETGTTTLKGGTINSDVRNSGTLTGNGTIAGTLRNAGTAKLGGVLDAVINSGTLTAQGNLSAKSLGNTGNVVIGDGATFAVSGPAKNEIGGTVTMDKGTFAGSLTNSGTIRGSGTISGMLTSDGGKLEIDGSMTVGDFHNIGDMTLATGDTLISKNVAENAGNLNVRGTLQSDLLNNGDLRLNGGTITGSVLNAAGHTIAGTGTIGGDLTNSGQAILAGTIGNVANIHEMTTVGALTVASLGNAGTLNVRKGGTLTSATAVQNAGTLNLGGTLAAELNNHKDATTQIAGGTVTGDVLNQGTLSGEGTFTGNLINRSGTAAIGGQVGKDLVNLGGTITASSNLTIEGQILNSASQQLVLNQKAKAQAAGPDAGLITIASGTTTTAKGGTQNGPGATIAIDGTLISNVLNNGTVINGGVLTGNIMNLGELTSNGRVNGSIQTGYDGKTFYKNASATLGGTITGDVTHVEGKLHLENGTKIGGTLDLHKDFALVDGQRISAGRTQVQKGTMLSLGGTIVGNAASAGTIKLTDNEATIAGNVENYGLVDLRNGDASTVLTTQGLSGNGIIALDVLADEDLKSDKVVVAGGATTGHIHLTFGELNAGGGATVGKATTLLDVDEAYSNTFTYSADELAASSERIVYSVEKNGNGDIQLVSQVNPAIGAMFGNVTLVQSLIGVIINRPASPYVTGLVTDYADKPCGVGGWGRATGGKSTVQGRTNNKVSNLENEVTANYYGMQGGVDLVCFDDRFAGWDMSLGVLAGVNVGDTNQPVYAIDSHNSQATTDRLASITSTDFQQIYGGVYMTGTKDRWTADLQVRGEKIDFELDNKPVDGSGLWIDTPEFSSKGVTVSGSIAYSLPIKDTGWVVTPNVGFAWSKFSTDSVSFEGDFELEFDDGERKIGFAGASLGKTFIRESENAAIHTFATATYFKDFADVAVSRLYNPTLEGFETQVITSENLKDFGEISVGANYVKVLNPGSSGRARQFSTSARIDGRFGDSIDSIGVTGQFRLQF